MFSKSSILARPGWSHTVFEELMGPPDETRKGPRKTQLFRPERVFAVETSIRFKEIMQPFDVLEYRAAAGHLLTTNRFSSLIDSMIFQVIVFTEVRVREGAIGHYNANRSGNFATRESTQDLLNRIMVEYARENLVLYDETIEESAIEAADENAVRVIRNNIYQAIAYTYPKLAQECFSQSERTRSTPLFR
jgi:hypothetical protein